jgi:hypothetical protein
MVSPSPREHDPYNLLTITARKIVSRYHIIAVIQQHGHKHKAATLVRQQPRFINERRKPGVLIGALPARWRIVLALSHRAAPLATAGNQRPSLSLACPWLVAQARQPAYVVGLGAASVPDLAPAACVAALFALAALPSLPPPRQSD